MCLNKYTTLIKAEFDQSITPSNTSQNGLKYNFPESSQI